MHAPYLASRLSPARQNLGEVNAPFPRGGEQTRAISIGQRFAGAEQCLGQHTAPVRALRADQLSLDNREGQAAVLEARGDRFSRDATTETDDVKLLRHFLLPMTRPHAARLRSILVPGWASLVSCNRGGDDHECG